MKKTSIFKTSFLALCGATIFTAPFSASAAEENEEETVIVSKTETFTMQPMSDHNAVSLQTITPDTPKKTVKTKTVKAPAKKVTTKKAATKKVTKKTTKKVVTKKKATTKK